MSRIGNNPINVPEGVKVSVDGRTIEVSGKNGVQSHQLHENIKINVSDNVATFERVDNTALSRSMHGTTRQIINNMIIEGISHNEILLILSLIILIKFLS